MHLGLLGLDDRTLRLAQAASSQGHQIVACWEDPQANTNDAAAQLGFPQLRNWDEFLTLPQLDGVIASPVREAADAEATRIAPLRALVQSGCSALVGHPFVPSTIAHYELDMACEESGARLVPFSSWRWSPAVARLQSLFGEGELGPLKQIALETHVANDRRETLSRHFAADVDLIRLLIGDVIRLHAMTTVLPVGDVLSAANNPAKDNNWPNLGIQLVGSTGAAGRWLPKIGATASSAPPQTVLHATGEHGQATLTVLTGDSQEQGTLTWSLGETTNEETFADSGQIEKSAINDFAATVTGRASRVTWSDACHATHAAESIGRSLKRGRVIDLNYDDYSEEGTFKGLMAAGGCLVLFAALAILTAGVVAGRIGWNRLDEIVPTLLMILLIGFLALQFFGMVFRGDKQSREQKPNSGDNSTLSKFAHQDERRQ